MPKKTAIQVASVLPKLDAQKEMASYACRGCKDHTIVQASMSSPYCASCGSGDLKRTEVASSVAEGDKLLKSKDAELSSVKCPSCASNLVMRTETACTLDQGGTGHVHCPACSQELSFVLPEGEGEEEANVDMDKLSGIADENDVDLTSTDGVATLSWPETIDVSEGSVTVSVTVSGSTVSALVRDAEDTVVWSGDPAGITDALVELGAEPDDAEALQEFAHDVIAVCTPSKETAGRMPVMAGNEGDGTDADSWDDEGTPPAKAQEELDAEAQEQADANADRDPGVNELAALRDLKSTASVVLASVIDGDYDFQASEEGGVNCVKGGVPVGVLSASDVEDPEAVVEALRLATSEEDANVEEILSSNGFDMTTLEIPAGEAIEQEVAARLEVARKDLETAGAQMSERLFQSMSIAMTGLNRGMFTELSSNPVVKAVASKLQELTDMTEEEAEAEAIACLDGSTDELASMVRDQTLELAGLDDKVRNDYATSIGKVRAPRATRQAETAAVKRQSALDLGDRLTNPLRQANAPKEQASTTKKPGASRIAELAKQSATFKS